MIQSVLRMYIMCHLRPLFVLRLSNCRVTISQQAEASSVTNQDPYEWVYPLYATMSPDSILQYTSYTLFKLPQGVRTHCSPCNQTFSRAASRASDSRWYTYYALPILYFSLVDASWAFVCSRLLARMMCECERNATRISGSRAMGNG